MDDLSKFLAAVRPKDRTTQYVVLAALFTLRADQKPVKAKEVGDLLRLHQGNKAPTNISLALRRTIPNVSPVNVSNKLHWMLPDNGISQLRKLSGLALATENKSEAYEYDIGIICALEHPELSAVRNAFGSTGSWDEIGDGSHTHIYRTSLIKTNEGQNLKIVATTSTSMGLTAAAIATTQLILKFKPKLVVMIGIAAGTKSNNKNFGDVLVADPSVDYNSGKVVDGNGIREFQPDPYPIGLYPRIRSVLQTYKSQPHFFETIRKKWKGALPKGSNTIHIGPLGAADQVIDDQSRILEIQKNWRKLIGVEMETYGVYRAAHESPDPKPRFISFKSVCDFAAEKNDSWQNYAAFFAAEFAADFIKKSWSSLWPKST
jgi:nucleoside phosphorylase